MKKAVIISLLFLCVINTMAQQPIIVTTPGMLKQFTDLGLPVVVINTINKEEPTCDMISAPQGEDGMTHTNANKVYGRIQILKGDDCVYDSGDYEEDVSGVMMRVRGNTSAQWSKKPFKLKLQKKADLLMRGDDSKYKDKEWILNAGFNVPDVLGTYVNSLVGLQWTPCITPVNLILNEDYRGIYLLSESVKRNVNCRLNVDESGFIFERDPYWWNEDVYIQTNTSHEYTFKYPKAEDVTTSQMNYLCDYMNTVESSFADGTYPDYIDVSSFARWLLGHDILSDWDCAGSNLFLTKYDDTPNSKVMMANMWDYGMVCRMPSDSWARVHYQYFYFTQLFNSPNKEFAREYKRLWQELYPTLKDNIFEYMRNYCNSEVTQCVDASLIWDMRRWAYSDGNPLLQLWNTYEPYLSNHFKWLNENINEIVDEDDPVWAGIADVNDNASNGPIYDLQGRRLNTIPEKGIYIQNGRKIILP